MIILSMSMSDQEKVGENRNGTFVITANLNLLKQRWNDIAGETVSNYAIVIHKDEGVDWYYLVAKMKDGGTITTSVDYVNNTFFVPNQSLSSSSTCSCTGCGYVGCDPRWLPNSKKWICDDPCLKCKKTVTATNKSVWSN